MSKSLRDQLLNKGLIDNKKAKAVAKQKQQALKEKHRTKSKSANAPLSSTSAQSEYNRRQQRERDRRLNLERKKQADQKALNAQIIQLVEQYKLDRNSAELEYNFNDQKIIKKILVTQSILKELSRGRLCIVRVNNSFEVVPKPIAEKIQQRDEAAIVVCNEDTQESGEKDSNDDYYAQFEIPDDLVW